MNLTKLLLILSFLSILVGQILRFSVFSASGAITTTDIFVFLTVLSFLVEIKKAKRKIKFPPQLTVPLVLFAIYALSVNVFAFTRLTFTQDLTATLFLARFLLYFSISTVAANLINKKEAESWLNTILTVGIGFSAIGLVQFIIFPDLTFLAAFGWDPHQKRVVSSLLDPNFSGYIYAMLASAAIVFFLFKQKKIYLFLLLIYLFSLVFTFSRSSYLAFIAMLSTLGILKSPKLIFLSAVCFSLIFIAVPRVQTRVLGALAIDETAQARLVSWQNASQIIAKNPIFGVGFDAYRYAQEKEGFFTSDQPLGGHSGSGTDSSLLLVLASTGIIGFTIFITLVLCILKVLFVNSKVHLVKLVGAVSFLGLLVHSLFVNSLFFPQIMLLVWFLVGISIVYDN